MFKIVRTVKQIYHAARNIQQVASASVNSIFKYSSVSKGYIEDASEEFSFLKTPRGQSSKDLIQDKFKDFNPNLANITKAKTTQLLDPAEIRKLIYARFADEIGAKSKTVVESRNLETKSNDTKEHVETFTTLNIADEFNDLRNQGYDFASARKAIKNQNIKSLSERMKELIKSGYMSSYSGEPDLSQEIELIMNRKSEVIKEFMQKVQDRAGFVSVDNAVLLVDSENDEAVTDDLTKADLLGEY